MNNLYGNPQNGFAPLGGPSSSFSFNNDALKSALLRIYQTDFNPLTDIESNLFNATWSTLNHAADKGFSMADVVPDDDFINAIRYNNAVFSAFRVHRMQNDIASRLLDADGKLKPYAQFAKDVAPITDHHIDSWLRTEYDTAVIRAHQAADWQQFEREKHILPNLEWVPSTSPTPGHDHKIFWGTVLPVNDPFWDDHRPGDRWNCKCGLRATDKGARMRPAGTEANAPLNKPAKGLDNNPGNDAMLFSFSHPFFQAGYMAYKKLAPIVERFVDKKLTTMAVTNLKAVRATMPVHNGVVVADKGFLTGSMRVLRRTLNDVLEHNKEDKWMKMWLASFKPEKLKGWKYEGWGQNRPFEANHPKFDPLNPSKPKHHEAEYFVYYSFKMNGKTYWANAKMHKQFKGEVLYTIEKNKPFDLITGRPEK